MFNTPTKKGCILCGMKTRKTTILLASALLLMALPAQAANQKFSALSDQFMKESLSRSPSTASQMGYHKHKDAKSGRVLELDAMLDDMSAEFMQGQKVFYASWRKRFATETPMASLDKQDAADWQLVDDQISLALLELDGIKNYQHNPTVVVEMIGSALFQPLAGNYAPKEKRVAHVVSRIEQVPRVLEQCKKYLNEAPPIFVSTAISENEGNIELIQKTILKDIKPGSAIHARYKQAAPKAIKALKDFNTWLKTNKKLAASDDAWRLGGQNYDQKFKYVMETSVTSVELLESAEREFKDVRAEMLAIATPMHQKYFGKKEVQDKDDTARENRIIGEVLKKISDEHPKRDQLLKAVEADLAGIKKFIADKKIVTLSPRNNLKVIPTPPYLRGIYSVAGFHSAPPLEPEARAEYWVTPIDPKDSAAKAESKLREYNNYTLKWLTIHEALPGHYIQFEHVNNIKPMQRRLLRSLYGNGAYIEGWAEYIAQVMLDEGYMKDNPKFRLTMRKIRLRLLANTILDIKMHTMKMSDQDALDLMIRDGFQTQAEAEGKLRRAKLSSCQLPTYYAGLREWLAFRKNYQDKHKDFNLLKFHNLVLDQGPLPVPVVEKLVN
jgi:uncharacterized protein (DUF885 family)